jgi:nicotinate-nucleotide adenylyltransferase
MTDLNIMADKQKIGVFGGAFNPVHNGHINLALHYLNELELDKILFIPTASPPHKSDDDFAPKEDRINMLSLAISSFDKFEISDIEFKLTGKSYTYLTLSELEKIYENAEFHLIIGADQMLHFDKWYKYKEILSLVTLCTSAREDEKEKAEILSFASRLDGNALVSCLFKTSFKYRKNTHINSSFILLDYILFIGRSELPPYN